jgi:ATP synthase protein I
MFLLQTLKFKKLNKNQHSAPKANIWDESSEDTYRVYNKAEMDDLRRLKPKQFASLNSWFIVLAQIVITLMLAGACYIFGGMSNRIVYTYSALVGGLIGFLPSTLFLMRLEAAKKSTKSSPGGYLTAVVSGEFIKILATVLLFIGFALKQPELKWIPLLVTYLATLKCYLLVWFWK